MYSTTYWAYDLTVELLNGLGAVCVVMLGLIACVIRVCEALEQNQEGK